MKISDEQRKKLKENGFKLVKRTVYYICDKKGNSLTPDFEDCDLDEAIKDAIVFAEEEK